ncbi:hypothetical protein ACMA1I_21255 [Pontibacter sp. 13R65]
MQRPLSIISSMLAVLLVLGLVAILNSCSYNTTTVADGTDLPDDIPDY